MNGINDSRRQRKARERRVIVTALAVVAAICVSAALFAWAHEYQAGFPSALATGALLDDENEIEQTYPSLTPSPSGLPISVAPAQGFSFSGSRLAAMSLADKVGQMLMVGVSGATLSPYECGLIQKVAPGGIAFHGGNVANPEQLSRLITDLKNCLGTDSHPPLFFAIDHEGQYINRFESGVTVFPAPLALGATGDPNLAYQSALASGQELSNAGVNMILGPVADVLTNLDSVAIAERSFGGDSQRVGGFVAAAVKGYHDAGLVATLKHFPGHGGVSVDSHESLPVDNADMQALLNIYFPPFQRGLEAGAPVVMVNHIAFPQIDSSGAAASLSKPSMDLLRAQLGFNGVILTDDLNMGALQSAGLDIPSIALESVRAGSDMLLILPLSDALAAKNKIQAAVEQGVLPFDQINRSVLRILQVKEQYGLAQSYPPPAAPNVQANQALADAIGYRSVAVIKNADGMIPVPSAIKTILAIAPPDNFGIEDRLTEQMQSRGVSIKFLNYYAPWSGISGDPAMINAFATEAATYDLTIIFTWQARAKRILYEDNWQSQMVSAVLRNNIPTIAVFLKSPADLLEFPSVKNCAATFGTTDGQIRAIIDTLTGKTIASGFNPLPQLP